MSPAADHVLTASGLLADFNRADVVNAADVHAATLIGELWNEPDQSVRLAIALIVRALRSGSVCLDITRLSHMVTDTLEEAPRDLPWPPPDEWAAAIRRSPAVGAGRLAEDPRPLRLHHDLLYLERYWRTEHTVRRHLNARQRRTPPPGHGSVLRHHLDVLFDDPDLPSDQPHHQRLAAAMTLLNQVTVVAGGPGTGKTTVVAKILALHEALRDAAPIVALAAPTGKAAARLEEAVLQTLAGLGAPYATTTVPPAVTLHRLLGWRRGQSAPTHTATNPLPHELVVIDEMSMVSLPQMAHLLEALRPEARLVLVGDPDQLAPVDAGAVLADITRAAPAAPTALIESLTELQPADRPAASPAGAGVVRLQHTWRYGGGIDLLARAIRSGDADRALDVLAGDGDDVRLVETSERLSATALASVEGQVVAVGRRMFEAAEHGATSAALQALEEHRVLCAHAHGPFGVARWERQVHEWIREAVSGYGHPGELHPGLPVMVTENDSEVGLYNGDTGVIVRIAQGLRAAFARGGAPTLFTSLQLNAVASVHAMTVHKSQGSQFRRVSVVLPPAESPLLTRELVYTAVTRAREGVEILGSADALVKAIRRPASRASGLGAVEAASGPGGG